MPSSEKPNVFPIIATPQKIACLICAEATICHSRSIADVAREYELPYTTVERWFYKYAPDQLVEETAQHMCVDEFALR
ncbi:MAG: hypothetical protein ABS949_16920 [Solibacillus sp.]